MSLIFGLLLLSAVLIGFEVILPGGVLGFAGILVFFGACFLGQVYYGWPGAIITFFGGGVFHGVFLFIGYKWFPNTPLGKEFIVEKEITGASNKGIPESVIGQSCISITPLRPTGLVLLGETQYEAISKDGYVDADTHLIVKAKDNFRVVVIHNENA